MPVFRANSARERNELFVAVNYQPIRSQASGFLLTFGILIFPFSLLDFGILQLFPSLSSPVLRI